MLSIDEAIERLKCMRLFMQIEDSENDSKFLEDDYIANDMAIEALEELKEARKGFNENRKAGYKHGYSDGYNKAIDEFAEKLHDLCGFEIDDIQYPYLLHESRIDEIAEQLKEGGIDGNERADT